MDPQECYPGVCASCNTTFPDRDEDLDDAWLCEECAADVAAEETADDWFDIAAHIAGVPF